MKRLTLIKIMLISYTLISIVFCKRAARKINSLQEINPVYQTTYINSEKDHQIKFVNGSYIKIKANTFVTGDNKPVKGKVKLEYRELHDPTDILLANVPMQYQQNENEMVLKTAGMFEIKANQKNQELKIASGKEIEVGMASYIHGDDYDFFQFDPEKKTWNKKGKGMLLYSEKKHKSLMAKNFLESENLILIGFMNFGCFYWEDWYSEYSKIREAYKEKINQFKKKLSEYNVTYHMTYLNTEVSFNNRQYPLAFIVFEKLNDEPIPNWIKNIQKDYYFIKIQINEVGKNTYEIYMAYNETRDDKEIVHKYTLKVKAIMPVNWLLRYKPDEWRTRFDELIAQAEELQKQADLIRTFRIRALGLYNFDIDLELQRFLVAKADFQIKGIKDNARMKKIMNQWDQRIYLVSGDNQIFISYSKEEWGKVRLFNIEDTKVFTFIRDNGLKIALFPIAKYNKIDFYNVPEGKIPTMKFDLIIQDRYISSSNDIREILGIKKMNNSLELLER